MIINVFGDNNGQKGTFLVLQLFTLVHQYLKGSARDEVLVIAYKLLLVTWGVLSCTIHLYT